MRIYLNLSRAYELSPHELFFCPDKQAQELFSDSPLFQFLPK